MRRLLSLPLLALTALFVFAGALSAPAQAQHAASRPAPLPVPYNFLPSAVLGGMPYSSAPGTNDFRCKPTRRHPRPVVLVHGLSGNRSTNWQTYGPLLRNHGYCVFALTYGVVPGTPLPADQLGGMGPMERSAVELKRFVKRVLRATHARKVDLVGHSEGTLMPDYYVKFLGGRKHVRSYISLAPLWHGTQLAASYGALLNSPFGPMPPVGCASCAQFAAGSAFLTKLRSGGTPKVKGVRYTNIVTTHDELVLPYTSGIQAGMRNIVLQQVCGQDYAEHFQIAADINASRIVLNRLDPARARSVRCQPVAPFVGAQPPVLPALPIP